MTSSTFLHIITSIDAIFFSDWGYKMTKIVTGNRIGKNSTLRVGCSAVIFNETRKEILLTKRADNGQWCLPSGGMEPGESASETCIREVREETGLDVEVKRLIGIYTSPHELIVYPDGNQFQLVAFCFEATVSGGKLNLSNETTEYGYFSSEQIQELDMLQNHIQRIRDALTFSTIVYIR
jgi:8-oxo-dGTP pyrophosphatase MutT (NUDIX family)